MLLRKAFEKCAQYRESTPDTSYTPGFQKAAEAMRSHPRCAVLLSSEQRVM